MLTLMWLSLACNHAPEEQGLLGHGWVDTYPSRHLLDEQGHVDLDPAWLPSVDTPMPTDALRYRKGFSVAQTALLNHPGVNAAAMDQVYLVDLTSGELHPSFAELDAMDSDVLLIRPLRTLPVGHDIAVVIGSQALERPQAFQLVLDGERLSEWQGHYQTVLTGGAKALGVAESEIGLVWDFPVDDGSLHLRTLAENTHPTGSYTWLDEDTTNLPPGVFKQVTGTFEVDDWLVDDVRFELDADGVPQVQGTRQAHLFVHVPDSVRGKELGTVPVLIFGHGLLQSPEGFLADRDDTSQFVDLFNRMEVIVVATQWRGLCRDDLADVVWVANDMGRLPEVTDRLSQGVANTLALMELVQDGPLMDDPAFEGLADPEQLLYYGVSLGAILGAVTVAQTDRIDHAVLHVGGGAWSTTFPRSANWEDFEGLVEDGIPSSADRQLLYAMMQLYWDPVDSMSYVQDLGAHSVVLQMSVNDDEVTNMGTIMLADSAGWSSLGGAVEGLPAVQAPTTGPVIVSYDPELGDPDIGNQPCTSWWTCRAKLRASAKKRSARRWTAEPLEGSSTELGSAFASDGVDAHCVGRALHGAVAGQHDDLLSRVQKALVQ
ncbi:MAG: hypothetical protein ACI9VR_004148 [Cognaticolwellia sp.]|jgi:hypothetical protein